MKNFDKKTIFSGCVIFLFLFAVLCCSLCGAAQAKNCAIDRVSSQTHHPCCPINKNNKNCPGSDVSNFLKGEKFENFTLKTVPQFAKKCFLAKEDVAKLSSISFAIISDQSPPKSLQKSVPIYLFDRVLRL